MATTPVPATPEHSHGSTGKAGKLVEYEDYIEEQLRKTRSHVRSVDLFCALLTMAAWVLGYFLLMALIDHWLVPGGFGFTGRLICFLVLVAGVAYHVVTQLLPLVVRRINPVYAAQTIERSRPSLKNSLINFLLLRSSPEGLSQGVYHALEEQAARNLARVPLEVAVDRSRLILIGYILLAILMLSAAYKLFSPKDPLRTAARIILPWAEVAAPTRTTIRDVQPGDIRVFRGQPLKIMAEVRGIGSNDAVNVIYSTEDGQILEKAIAMRVPADDYRHACVLTTDDEGVQQNVAYRIEAGDCVTRTYKVEVIAAPTIVVQSVDYAYPDYTGLVAQHVENQGDLKAIEGTQVTIHALANQPIHTATIDLNCDGAHPQPMQTAGDRASGIVTLALKPDRTSPEYASYQLRLKNSAGQENPEPVRYQIEVTADLAPEVQFLAPEKADLELPANGSATWEVVANDPDFSLGRVSVLATRGQQTLFERALLEEPRRGQFNAKFRFEPRKLGLKPGDIVQYWAVAEDNKQPQPNRSETAKRRIVIVAPDPASGRSGADKQSRDQGRQNRQDEAASDPNAQQPDQNAQQQSGPQNQKRIEDRQRQGAQQSQDRRDNQSSQQQGQQEQQSSANPSKGANQQEQADQQQQSGGQQDQDKAGQDSGQNGASGQTSDDNNAAGQSRDSKNQGGRNQPVANDGSNDGDAFDRILKHRDEQSGKQGQQSQSQAGGASTGGTQNQKQSEQQQQPQDQGGGATQQGQSNQQQNQQQNAQPDQQQGAGSQDGSSQPGQSSSNQSRQPQSQSHQSGQQTGQASSAEQQPPSGAANTPNQGTGRTPGRSQQPNPQAGNSNSKGQRGEQGQEQGQEGQDQAPSGAQSAKSTSADSHGQQDQINATSDQSQSSPPGETKPGGKPSADPRQANQTNEDPSRNGDARETQGQGAKSRGSARDEAGKKSSTDRQRPNARGGDPNENKGQSGAGKASRDDRGSPQPQGELSDQQRNSKPESQGGQRDSADQADSPATNPRESNSESDTAGDQRGGGGKGGGQKANKSGTGGAGNNTAADEGSGASPERGEGQTGNRPGDQQQSDKPTGRAGQERGAGSTSRTASGDRGQSGRENTSDRAAQAQQQARGEPGSGDEGQPSQTPRTSQPSASGGAGGTGAASSNPLRANTATPPPRSEKSPDVAEQANLEYTKKATELALAHLRDQLKSGDPDPELLDRLGWTRDDLEQFLRRWEAMQRSAKTPGPKGQSAQRELDDTLRSLGLRPRGSSLGSSAARDDEIRGLKESQRTSPPADYADQYKAYTRGTSRGEK